MSQQSSEAQVQDDAPAGQANAEKADRSAAAGLRAVVGRETPEAKASSPDAGLGELDRRIMRLERQNRWLKVGLLVVFLIGGLYAGNAVLPPDVIVRQTQVESRELKLLDSEGNARMFLRMYSRVPVLQLLDESGKPRMSLGLRFDDTPFLDLSDRTGRTRASIELNEAGQPSIALFDENGESTTRMR